MRAAKDVISGCPAGRVYCSVVDWRDGEKCMGVLNGARLGVPAGVVRFRKSVSRRCERVGVVGQLAAVALVQRRRVRDRAMSHYFIACFYSVYLSIAQVVTGYQEWTCPVASR